MADLALLDSGSGDALLVRTGSTDLGVHVAEDEGGGGSSSTGELRMWLKILLDNGNLHRDIREYLSLDQSMQGSNWRTHIIGTSEEDIPMTDINTEGWCFLRNLDDTNYVTFGPKSGTMVAFGRIKAHEIAAYRLEPMVTIRAIANTASVRLDVLILED